MDYNKWVCLWVEEVWARCFNKKSSWISFNYGNKGCRSELWQWFHVVLAPLSPLQKRSCFKRHVGLQYGLYCFKWNVLSFLFRWRCLQLVGLKLYSFKFSRSKTLAVLCFEHFRHFANHCVETRDCSSPMRSFGCHGCVYVKSVDVREPPGCIRRLHWSCTEHSS